MAALHSPTQVAGTHSAIYEAYYNKIDPNGSGVIQALDAARFLKKSNLSDIILSKIWDLSDPSGRGYLDKGGLFVALKLVALAQAGKEISMANINSETPPPKVGEIPKVPPNVPPPPASDWSVKPAERDKYNQLFDSLQPSNGLIPGNKVKGVLMESKLPMPTLGKIWDLADQDKDGMLDRHEFVVAMHLVYKALEKHAIPAVLPPELKAPSGSSGAHGPPPPRPPSRPASRPQSPTPSRPPPPRPAVSSVPLAPIIPSLIPDIQSAPPTSSDIKPWVVTPAEKHQYDNLFVKADKDMDGFVSGMEIKDTFLQSGLPQQTLAHIWGLCDWDSSGKLSMDQFALAMWMVQRKLRGIDPPAALAPDMIPPSARSDQQQQPAPPKELQLNLGPQATPEMEALARDMEQLARERLALEAEVSSKEQSIRSKTSEANSLQSELDTLAATLKQLENQRGEAQKRLNDLQAQVEKLRVQAKAQEAVVNAADEEATIRRDAAAGLKKREEELNKELAQSNKSVEDLSTQLQKSVLAISQANLKLTHLEDEERRSNEAVEALTAALANGPAPAHQHLQLQPPPTPHQLRLLVKGDEDSPTDDAFGSMNGPSKSGDGGFASDPFKDDPFTNNNISNSNKPSNDPFAPSSNNNGFAADPFTSSNFGGSTPDPFGGDAFSSTQDNKNKTDNASDPFGCDPFAILHAPTRDGSSPTPSLPPKKHKQPPPRPAPPRPSQPPASSAQFNADFSAFNDKLPSKSPMPAPSPKKTPASSLGTQPTSKQPKSKSPMDFTEDPFRDYRYEDPFNLDDPFADNIDGNKQPSQDTFGAFSTLPSMKSSVKTLNNNNNNSSAFTAFDSDDFFSTSASKENNNNDGFGGRQSVPLPTNDPFSKSGRISAPITANNSNLSWATWDDNNPSNIDWASNDSWVNSTAVSNVIQTTTPQPNKTSSGFSTWSAGKNKLELPEKKEKKEKSPKSGRSFTQALHLGRHKNKSKNSSANSNSSNNNNMSSHALESGTGQDLSWQQQLAWAEQESKRMEDERRKRQEAEERELKLAMELSLRNQ